MDYQSALLQVEEPSQVGSARRLARSFGELAAFDETKLGRLAIAVTELATNILRHAGRGWLLLHRVRDADGASAIDAVSIDGGPGIKDVDRALLDGFSSAGTPGNGLGAIRRQSDAFDVWSSPDRGTVVLARFHSVSPEVVAPLPLQWAAVSLPVAGETVSGDCWRISHSADATSFLVADGLGHGPDAALAAEAVATGFLEEPEAMPDRRIMAGHRRAQGSRGAAAAIVRIGHRSTALQFAGIGNISGSVLSKGRSRGMMSHGGIVGLQMRTVRSLDFPWPDDGMLILHSDGIRTRWDLNDYPRLQRCDPMLIAAILLRDYRRERDDATVLVARRSARP